MSITEEGVEVLYGLESRGPSIDERSGADTDGAEEHERVPEDPAWAWGDEWFECAVEGGVL